MKGKSSQGWTHCADKVQLRVSWNKLYISYIYKSMQPTHASTVQTYLLLFTADAFVTLPSRKFHFNCTRCCWRFLKKHSDSSTFIKKTKSKRRRIKEKVICEKQKQKTWVYISVTFKFKRCIVTDFASNWHVELITIILCVILERPGVQNTTKCYS